MPQPTRSDVHVNRPLTNISIAYIQKAADFVADKVFPIVPVMKQSDLYFQYEKKYWFQTQSKKRAPASESSGSGFGVDAGGNYFCDIWAVHKDIDDQTRQNADDPLNMDRDATLFVTQQQLLRREILFMSKYVKAGLWNGAADFTPSTKWSASGSNPMLDVDNKKAEIKSKTGFAPNTLAITYDVFQALKNNPAVLDRIKYTQRGIITEDLLAALFGVDKFLVMQAVQDSAAEGAAASMDFLVKNCALLCYANPAPSIMQPSAGYTFAWQGLFGAGAQGGRIMTFRMEHLKADRVEGEMAFDQKVVATDLGCFLQGLLS
jgi:hypothetical protein